MAPPPPRKKRTTIIGRKIRQHLNQRVRVFLENGIALEGVLLDYAYDPVEKDGILTLSSKVEGGPPSLIFRSQLTTIQPNLNQPAQPVQRSA